MKINPPPQKTEKIPCWQNVLDIPIALNRWMRTDTNAGTKMRIRRGRLALDTSSSSS